jgi:hypothetical protein
MHRRAVLREFGFAALGLAIVPGAAFAQQKSLKEQLVGTWKFVSSNAKRADGSPLWGQNPKGLFIITSDGHFSWQVFRSDRPNFPDRLKATADEHKTIMIGSLAYFGTYSVDEGENTVSFFTDGSTFPHSEGETLKRIIKKLTPDELVYTNPATTTGAQVEAVWKRVR